ncbi:hypothetical protein PHMEG_0006595 [Phytophthora megakarya]|uniref:RNase H type-1 domain-containing protein n=1 Tax=Phytophthora megakarya TaxID=4795 RepID=A0A225WPY9_9STRA|nr:hypothetical protein PHMEG_0006595 [Phytophthora megakarya]
MAEYSGMNNGVQAALDIGATDLVIVDDSIIAIQPSLGMIAGKKESLMNQLNRHRELVPRPKSVKYLHVVREYNASADALATEASENKVSSVISTEPRLAELRPLNRIQEVIYAPITWSSTDEPSVSIAQSRIQIRHLRHTKPSQQYESVPETRRNNFFDFVREDQREIGDLTRVRLVDETLVTDAAGAAQREETNSLPTEDSVHEEAQLSMITVPKCDTSVSTNAEEVDRLTVQRERRRRIATAQDEELRWAKFEDSYPQGRINPCVPCSERRVENVGPLRPKRRQCVLLCGNEASEKCSSKRTRCYV